MRELFDEVAGKSALDPQEAVRRTTRGPQRKRFYASAGVGEGNGGFSITLDGKPIRTPSGYQVIVPVRSIAEAIAAEWNAQGETIEPLTMPLTRLANSVIEGVVDKVEAVADDVGEISGLRSVVLPRRPSRGAGRARGSTLGSDSVLGGGRAGRPFHSRRRAGARPPARFQRSLLRGRRCHRMRGRSRRCMW